MSQTVRYSRLDEIPSGEASDIIQEGCLVLEGGAFRGLYNQGVLDAFMQHDINIHTVVGVSAGALAGLNYVAGHIGRSARANLGFRHDSRYIGVKALRHGHSLIDLDFLLDTLNEYEPVNRERLNSDKRHFVAVATNCKTGKTEYFDKNNCSDIEKAIKASASMPYISPMVDVDGVPCLDGGCSCKLAYQWALDQGFEKIIVIRTRQRGYRKKIKDSTVARRFYRKYKAFATALIRSDREYNRECRILEELEKKGRVYCIAPDKPVTVGRIEGDVEKLGELYWEGYEDAMARIDEIKAYLGM